MALNPQPQPSPAEVLAQLSQGYNGYTDPTLTQPTMWANSANCFSGAFGYVQRCRFANLVNGSGSGYTAQSLPFTTFKFYSLPALSSYLLADNDGKLWSFDTGNNYSAIQRINPYVFQLPNASTLLTGPWSREVLQNIVYEMNGQVKQAGRTANASIIESWGLDAPDVSPQIVISSGSSQTITNIQRTNGVVTVTLGGTLTVPGGNAGMVNVTITSGDTSFAGTFAITGGSGTATLTWLQPGQNTALLTPTGTVDVNITKSVGRSYAHAWENANKAHISAPSPVSQYIQYNAQNGAIQLVEQGTISWSGTAVTGTGTSFTSAWVGRQVWAVGAGAIGTVVSVTNATSMTLGANAGAGSNIVFQIFDPSATHIRLYATADGGATWFRIQRNAFLPTVSSLVSSGLQFFDNANAEPPNFPFTTEISQLFNVPPPIGSFVKEYQGRLLVYGITGLNQTFFYSNIESTTIGQPQESFAPLNQVTLPIQNASINGMADFPGALVIWSDKQDMFRVTGNFTDNTPLGAGATTTGIAQGATITALPYNLGCASPYSVAITPLGAIWLADNKEVWLYTDSYAPRNIGRPIQDILNNIPQSQLNQCRATYFHTRERNWYVLAVPNGSSNNTLLVLDLDLLASNGSPSYFVFDMATNHPAWFPFALPCTAVETVYEQSGIVRLLVGGVDIITDADYRGGLFGTEQPVPNAFFKTHAFGNESAFILKRPQFLRFTTNRDPSLLATDGWSWVAEGIDDDFYTFNSPLTLALTPGVNDTSTLSGGLPSGEAFRHSPELFRMGGVNFMMGRRLRFQTNFPSGAGVDYQLRTIQVGFGVAPPR